MARLSYLTLFVLALASSVVAAFAPPQNPLNGADDSVSVSSSWEYKDCGAPSDAIQIKSIKVSPDPPQAGKNLTVTVNGVALERIEEGAYADVTVKLGLIKILQKQFDVCDEAKKADAQVQCPVEKGEYTVVQTAELPKEIPKAKFVVNVRGYTADDDDMVCLDLIMNFMDRPFFGFGW